MTSPSSALAPAPVFVPATGTASQRTWRAAARLIATVLAGLLHASAGGQIAAERQYDIPAQRLEGALLALGRESGIDILYDRGVLDGLRSTALLGRFSPPAAVATMLQGTGLKHRFTSATAVLILPPDRGERTEESGGAHATGGAPRLMLDRLRVTAAPTIGGKNTPDYTAFGQMVRATIMHALQANPRTAGRPFTARLSVRLDPQGVVQGLAVQRSSGNRRLDRDIIDALYGTSMAAPPPATMPQPIWFDVVAR